MFSQMRVDFTKVAKANLNQEILRAAIIAELDAINFYEQMAALTEIRTSGPSSWISPGRKKPT